MDEHGAEAVSSRDDERLEAAGADAAREGSGVRASPPAPAETDELTAQDEALLPPPPRVPSFSNGELATELPSEPPPFEHLAPGTLIADRFRIGRMIGRGGHGSVYEAEHVVLGYPVAIKVLHAAFGADARRRARFRREALLGARLRHRNVASIHDAGELEDGSPFLVMEHVDGDDLATVIARCRTLDAAATVEIGVQLLAAVTALCERGVIHRDIKPNNVMLQRAIDGYVEVKLLDFGISKAMRAELALKTLTADDCVLGTPQYMSPEQVKGETLDVRADLYSVGALLYECLTGTPPFDAETPGAVLAKILTEDARPVRAIRPDAPESLAAIVDRAVAKVPDERWGNPAEMAEALRAVAQRLHLPRGADAWASLAASPSAPLGTAAIGLVRPKTSSRPPTPASTGSGPKVLPTAPERPISKSGRIAVSRSYPPEATARFLLPTVGSLGALRSLGRSGARRWLAVAAAVPIAIAAYASAGAWGGEGTSHADAATAARPSTKAPEPETPPAGAAPAPGPAVEAAAVAAIGPEAGPEAVGEAPAVPNVLRPIGTSTPAGDRGPRRADPAEIERRALSAFLAGRDAEAVSLYTRATQLAPGRPTAWRGLGLAASARDRRTASRALRRYLELAPDAPDRRSIEQRLARL